MKRWIFALLAAVAVLGPGEGRAQISCAPPPPEPPKRIAGGEGFPPLPLPATPLRRTERKRPPAPPTLLAKVNYGAVQVQRGGQLLWEWTTATGDTQGLFRFANGTAGLQYKADVVRLNQFTYAPETVPIMYFTGREAFALSDQQRDALKRYVLEGGAILGAAGNGTPAFSDAFVREMRLLFPDRPWHAVPADHPVFRAHFQLEKIQYRIGADDLRSEPPRLEGINLGCRAAILLSRADLSCGWDDHTHPDGFRVMPEDAKRLGLNLATYLLASYRLGRISSIPVVFREAEGVPGELQIGQIVHEGDWDPCPSALQYLLKRVSEETSAGVNFRRLPIDPAGADLFRFPFLYLTGHLDFRWSPAAVENLRRYLGRGGFLLVSDCCCRRAFDQALRRELGRVYPDSPLQPLDPGHAVYAAHYDLGAGTGVAGPLEGITRDGETVVLYSPAGLGSAWDGEPRPGVSLPDTEAARRMGVNAVVYAMTH